MTLHDPNNLTFGGEGVLARGRARLVVEDGSDLSQEQEAWIASFYRRFWSINRPSIATRAVRHEIMPDGSIVRAESNHGQDVIYVMPAHGSHFAAITLGGFVGLPADKDNTSGWNKGAIADSARAYLPAKKNAMQLHVKLRAGAVDWRSANGKHILSWDHGGANRYETHLWDDIFGSGGGGTSGASTGIYYKGTLIETPSAVLAACIFQGWLVYVTGDSPVQIGVASSPIASIDRSLAVGHFRKTVSPTWSFVTPVSVGTYGTDYGRVSAWHFAPDGAKAACALVDHTYGLGTWFNRRMRLEVLPQSKLYLNLAPDGFGSVAATLSKTAYASGEAFTVTVAGTVLDHTGVAARPLGGPVRNSTSGDVPAAGGALVFAGRRLWGVDFAADGTELVIEGKRSGSGLLSINTGTGDVDCDFLTKWAILVNGTELVAAHYNMPTMHTDATNASTQTGAGLASFEYMSLVALDARSLSAIVERLTVSSSAALVAQAPVLGVPQDASTRVDKAIARETYLNGALEQTITQTPLTALLAGVQPVIEMNAQNWLIWLRYGPRISGVDGNIASDGIVTQYPVTGGREGENYYEWAYQTNAYGGPADDRMVHNIVKTFPNQVSSALFHLIGHYTASTGGTGLVDYEFIWYPWLGTFVDDGSGSFPAYLDDRMIPIGTVTSVRWPGLAEREKAPLEALVAERDSFLWDFELALNRAIYFCTHGVRTTGLGFTERNPVYTAHHFLRDTPSGAWTITELASIIEAQLTADGHTPDADSFYLHPIGPL